MVGAFQLAVRVDTKQGLLLKEERLLATLRWLALKMPTEKRWYPVLARYIEYVGRVQGFGGDPTGIIPSPTGHVPGLPEPHGGHHHRHPHPDPHHHHGDELVGKVHTIWFDHFGDFEGFTLETEKAHERFLASRERPVRDMVEMAQRDRRRIKVIVERDGRHILSIAIL